MLGGAMDGYLGKRYSGEGLISYIRRSFDVFGFLIPVFTLKDTHPAYIISDLRMITFRSSDASCYADCVAIFQCWTRECT
jgi:hypothetical protein